MNLQSHGNTLPSGYRLHWYRIDSVLGQGGFGITYLAHDTNLNKQVAIKEYLPVALAVRESDSTVRPFTEDRREQYRWGLTRFIEEARTLAALEHPNIVRVHSVFEENATAYMVMAYEVGDGLDDLAKFARLDSETALLAIAHPLLDALEHIHVAGFVHRDVKPANIVVRPDGNPVLLDFGSARLALGDETRTLTSVVSAGYAPYEQYHSDGGRQGPWTDLYGLGASLYAAMNRGRGPLDAIVRGNARIEGTPDPMQAASVLGAGRYSQQLLRAIDAALAFTPAERPQSTVEFRALLPATNAAQGLPVADDVPTVVRMAAAPRPLASPQSGPGKQPPPSPQKAVPRRRLRWAHALLVFGVLAAMLYGFGKRDESGDVATGADLPAVKEQQAPAAEVAAAGAQQTPAAEAAAVSAQQTPAAEAAAVSAQQAPAAEVAAVRVQAELARIRALLAGAEKDRAALRLTSPQGENAVAKYREVLTLDTGNAKARAGLAAVVERYIALAGEVTAQGRFAEAAAYLQRATDVLPEAGNIQIAREALRFAQQAHKQSLDRQAAQREVQQQATHPAAGARQADEIAQRTAAPEQAPRFAPGLVFNDTLKDGSKGPDMIVIPAGLFRMGDLQGDGDADEGPVRAVRVERAFALGRTEVTFDEYDRFARAGGRGLPKDEGWGRGQRPVIHVSWDDASAYAQWLSAQTGKRYRLPSEAQWEYAARAGTTTARHWGNDADAACRFANVHDRTSKRINTTFSWLPHECDDGHAQSAPVASFSANAFGLKDMLGNVWEWTADCWNDSYSGAPRNESPRSSGDCALRVGRGSSWSNYPTHVRSANRSRHATGLRANFIGIRLARDMSSFTVGD